MSKPPPKGFVLAAGLGTRLRPLTEHFPKPLIPFAGSSPLELALWRLKMAGLEEVAVNSHYLPAQIKEFVQKNPFGQRLKLSHEREILGTGGAYNPLRGWQGESDLVVYNGDVVTDIDVDALIDVHEDSGAVATMALLPQVIPGESAVWCVSAGGNGAPSARVGDQIMGFGRSAPAGQTGLVPRNFACVQVLSRRFIEFLPKTGVFDVISKGYEAALAAGELVVGHVHDGFWHDLRSPYFFFEALKELLLRDPARDITGLFAVQRHLGKDSVMIPAGKEIQSDFSVVGPVLHATRARIGADAHLGPFVVVDGDAEIGGGATLSHCIVLAGAKVDAAEKLSGQIVGKGFRATVGASP
jgi:mannose-1-phosphate guanylyltransferase